MLKKNLIFILTCTFLILVTGCNQTTTKPQVSSTTQTTISSDTLTTTTKTTATISTTTTEQSQSIAQVIGIDDTNHIQNEYFHPLKNVRIIDNLGNDITHLLTVSGNVNYGKLGSYELTYKLSYGDTHLLEKRVIEIIEGDISRTSYTRDQISDSIMFIDSGSYRLGNAQEIKHPINPIYINQDLLTKAIPSNSWWTQLLVQNYGGGNGIYTNPLRSSFSNLGVEVTNPGSGFVQYWNPDGLNTMANFSLALPDMFLKSTTLNSDYTTQVIDYSDTTVTVAMRNFNQPEDQMVISYAQGSPFIFAETSNTDSAYLTLATNGVSNYEFFNLTGIPITSNNYTGSGFIIKLVQKHVGYVTFRPNGVGQPIHKDLYFLVSTPKDSEFSFSSNNHPFGLINRIDLDLKNENYFSVAAINSLSEATYYHSFAYNRSLSGKVSYEVDEQSSLVNTTYHQTLQNLNDSSNNLLIQFLMPHHYQNSDIELTNKEFQTVRGTLKLIEANSFQTQLTFNGVVPAMSIPTNPEFNSNDLLNYLNDLDNQTKIDDEDNFLNATGPYWNGKALYPLSQGLIIADQLNDETLKNSFIEKLRYLLEDWFTYSSTTDEKYLYYNQAWGTVYYSNNDFNTATELSDHSFTHGYLIYAASVLGMYDPTFISEYGGLVKLLIDDIAYSNRDDYNFRYLRSFDPWAGHTWAHGFGTFAEGNNIESSSEAINSWVGIYLWSLNTNDLALRDAAIYGFVHEVSSAKTYMFDYSQTIFPENYSQYALVAGMIWGGKYDYQTWFGANPTFIYGIQWLPNGQYLSNYALTTEDREYLERVFNMYLSAKNSVIDTWFANMWSIQALIDIDLALSQFNANLILDDDYPSDLAQTYYLLNAIKTYGNRNIDYYMVLNDFVSSSIYELDSGTIIAITWNPSNQDQTVQFINNGVVIEKIIPANSLTSTILED